MGHFHPGNIIDNAFLEELDIGTNDAWILERVGIHTRRTVLPLEYIRKTKNQDPRQGQEAAEMDSRQTATAAADMALERAGISRNQIGLVIAGGCYPDMAIPSEAARIAGTMGIDAPASTSTPRAQLSGRRCTFCPPCRGCRSTCSSSTPRTRRLPSTMPTGAQPYFGVMAPVPQWCL